MSGNQNTCFKSHMAVGVFCLAMSLLLYGCDVPVAESPLGSHGCVCCHSLEIDPAHQKIGCVRCHRGDPLGRTVRAAHKDLVPNPAHPENMDQFCGPCHRQEVRAARDSIHYTLSGEIGLVWRGFFPGSRVPTVKELSDQGPPTTARGLVADLLRRRCLRCHVYYAGDDYSMVRRGTGCAACHMRNTVNGPQDHRFYGRVSDDRCLSCHYGNFVGMDYYGGFEKDYEDEYRAPLKRGRHLDRPYGVEWFEMTPDIHRRKGLGCTDCHTSGPCSGRGELGKSCLHCHLESDEAERMDQSMPGHRISDRDRVSCAACHALWAFMDRGRFLARQDAPDLDFWDFLAIQGSSEVEHAVLERKVPAGLHVPGMSDKFTGRLTPGIWFQGFYLRRWGPVVIGESEKGRLEVLRPLLELYLSYVNSDEDVVFDNITPEGMDSNPWLGWVPYHPHTIGKADVSRTRRVSEWLRSDHGK